MTIGKECSKVGRAQMEKSLYLAHTCTLLYHKKYRAADVAL